MTTFLFSLLIALNLRVPQAAPLQIDTCAWEDGGYCVATLASVTRKVLKVPSTDDLASGVACYNFYDAVWTSGIFPDKQAAFDEATAAGGTKIGGVNLVVLAARTLQAMVDANIITLMEAQAMLNAAKNSRGSNL